jgi:aldehyde:ferredoxin oxidoreductase
VDWYGYNGKILTIDLEKDHFSESVIKTNYIEDYIGGFGLNCRLFAERFVPGTDPFSDLNPIIIGAGPLVGTGVPGASRTVAITKFPATGAIANSCGSMSFGFHLKQSGFDHIIIENKADSPIVLVISDDYYELLDANDLWGLDIVKATNILYSEFSDSSVICIGQAGEKLIPQAMSLIDRTSTLGRGGLGAVMGAKNLKAILVKGSKGIKVAEPGNFQKVYSKFMRRVKNYPHRDSWIELGMLRSLPVGMILQAKVEKEKAKQCNERTYLKKIKERRIACPSCPMADKDILKVDNGTLGELVCYTSSVINPFLMFTSDFLTNYKEAIRIFDLINRYGLDAFTLTSMLEFLQRNYENGSITQNDLGFHLTMDYETIHTIVEMIIKKEGIGKHLADGWKGLLNKFPELKDDMDYVKGLDIIFEPRFLK